MTGLPRLNPVTVYAVRGEPFGFTVTSLTSAGEPFDYSGYTADLAVYEHTDSLEPVYAHASTDPGPDSVQIIDPPAGKVGVSLTGQTTGSWEFDSAVFALRVHGPAPASVLHILTRGRIVVEGGPG